jgi:hypothetical protein
VRLEILEILSFNIRLTEQGIGAPLCTKKLYDLVAYIDDSLNTSKEQGIGASQCTKKGAYIDASLNTSANKV